MFLLSPNSAMPDRDLNGFRTEIKNIRAKRPVDNERDAPSRLSRSSGVTRESLRFCRALYYVFLDVVRFAWGGLGMRLGLGRFAVGDRRHAKVLRYFGVYSKDRLPLPQVMTFANLPEVDDADDEDFQPGSSASSDSSSSSDSDDELAEDDAIDVIDSEATGRMELYSDLFNPAQPEIRPTAEDNEELGALVLAHMSSSSPITRQRYRHTGSAVTRPVAEVDPDRLEQLSTQLVCVVCRSETRQIICWPCRRLLLSCRLGFPLTLLAGCLSLCESCKDTLAAVHTRPRSYSISN